MAADSQDMSRPRSRPAPPPGDPLGDREPVEVRKHHIEQHHVRPQEHGLRQHAAPVCSLAGHDIPARRQQQACEPPEPPVVINHQHAQRHSPMVTPLSQPRESAQG
jgi:hypothetical protein